MSGICTASGYDTSSGGGVPPLNGTLSWGGSDPYNVAGASNASSDVFTYTASGGVPPYTISSSTVGNASGKLDVFAVSDPSGNGTFGMFWTGFSVNETESATFRTTIQDSVGTISLHSRSLSVKRTS